MNKFAQLVNFRGSGVYARRNKNRLLLYCEPLLTSIGVGRTRTKTQWTRTYTLSNEISGRGSAPSAYRASPNSLYPLLFKNSTPLLSAFSALSFGLGPRSLSQTPRARSIVSPIWKAKHLVDVVSFTSLSGEDEWCVAIVVGQVWVDVIDICQQLQDRHETTGGGVTQPGLQHVNHYQSINQYQSITVSG